MKKKKQILQFHPSYFLSSLRAIDQTQFAFDETQFQTDHTTDQILCLRGFISNFVK